MGTFNTLGVGVEDYSILVHPPYQIMPPSLTVFQTLSLAYFILASCHLSPVRTGALQISGLLRPLVFALYALGPSTSRRSLILLLYYVTYRPILRFHFEHPSHNHSLSATWSVSPRLRIAIDLGPPPRRRCGCALPD